MTSSDYAGDLAELYTVIANGYVGPLKEAISNGFDATRDLLHGGSVIESAIRHSEETLTRVFEIIGTVDIAGVAGSTPLLQSVAANEYRDARLLLSLGASVERTNIAGDNVFHLAADVHVEQEIAELLTPHATLRSLLTHCVGMQTPITRAIEDESYGRCSLFCKRYVELGGSLDVKVGCPPTPMRRIVEKVIES
ncbi:MAG TPA: hypothetical protein PKN33_00255 [Phycisphaerae bacterium]|nr:hypothetical protein [Phycisphaerae bacterium]